MRGHRISVATEAPHGACTTDTSPVSSYLQPPQQQVVPTPQQPPVMPPHHDQDVPYDQLPPAGPSPEPHGQRLPHMHASPPCLAPQGPGPAAVPQTTSSTWKDLDVVIQTVRSLKTTLGLGNSTLLPGIVRKRVTDAVTSLKEAAQELEHWMQAPDGWDPVEVARAGRLRCLQRLHKQGRFLDLYSPHRASAGEARKAEAWLAALAACEAGHAHVLRWLFRDGWPPSFDAEPPWHLRDMAESWMKRFGTVPEQQSAGLGKRWLQPALACFPPEVKLYCFAMRAPACLDALLEAGARSAWICRAAILEGRADLLRLAVARGCPCDAECLFSAARTGQVAVLEEVLVLGLDSLLETTNRLWPDHETKNSWPRTPAALVRQAGVEAAAGGQEACLEVLLRWHPDLICGDSVVACAAARAGNLNCLQLLQRAGLKEWRGTVYAAAGNADNLPCLQFALQLDPTSGEPHPDVHAVLECAMSAAAQAGSLANLKALHEAKCHWTCFELVRAISSDNLDVVKFCLEHGDLVSRFLGMSAAKGKAPIMQLFYEAGFPPDWMRGREHPAVQAIAVGSLEATQIAVKYIGVPDLEYTDTRNAAKGGQLLLQYVLGLGATVHEGTATAAAKSGQLGALRYAIQNGAPWDRGTLLGAIEGDSLDCLRYAHDGGCPDDSPEEFYHPVFAAARSLPVLRYVCEHMGPTWSAGVLHETSWLLGNIIHQADAKESLDWQVALYTVKQFRKSREAGMQREDLPARLAEAVLMREERAAALAGAFFKAGQLAQGMADTFVGAGLALNGWPPARVVAEDCFHGAPGPPACTALLNVTSAPRVRSLALNIE